MGGSVATAAPPKTGSNRLGVDTTPGCSVGGSCRINPPDAAPAPAYCVGARADSRRPRNILIRKRAPNTSSATMRMFAKPSDNPKCESNAASPMPAARPASGPIQRDAPEAAGAAALGGIACDGATGPEGATLGVLAGGGVAWRCAPRLRPPPRRRASAVSVATTAVAAMIASARIRNRFMQCLRYSFRVRFLVTGLIHPTYMDGDDTRRQIVKLDVVKTGILHHLFQRGLIRMDANGFRQVAIARLVIGDQLAQ